MKRRLLPLWTLAVVPWVYAYPTLVHAHPSGVNPRPPVAEFTLDNFSDWFVWDFNPSIAIGTAIFCTLYVLGVTVWRKKYNLHPTPPKAWEVFLFFFSNALMYVSLDGLLHYLSDELSFAAHMSQHLLLQTIWAPLLVISIPGWLVKPIASHPVVNKVGRWVTGASRSTLMFMGMMYFWHLPPLYELALYTHGWHIAEHVMFMVTAIIFWWAIFSRSEEVPRASIPKRAAMLFLGMFPMKALGLIIATHNSLIYEYYASQPRLFALTPVGDQRAGGLMMWILAELPMWAALGHVFYEWRRSTPRGLTGIKALDEGRTAKPEPGKVGLSEGSAAQVSP